MCAFAINLIWWLHSEWIRIGKIPFGFVEKNKNVFFFSRKIKQKHKTRIENILFRLGSVGYWIWMLNVILYAPSWMNDPNFNYNSQNVWKVQMMAIEWKWNKKRNKKSNLNGKHKRESFSKRSIRILNTIVSPLTLTTLAAVIFFCSFFLVLLLFLLAWCGWLYHRITSDNLQNDTQHLRKKRTKIG